MQRKAIVPAIVLTAAAAVSLNTFAADVPKGGEQADKPAATKVGPHNHMQEKTGMAPQKKSAKAMPAEAKSGKPAATGEKAAGDADQKSAGAKTTKTNADKDKSRHYHPRDGK